MDGCIHGCMDGCKQGCMDGCTQGCMEEGDERWESLCETLLQVTKLQCFPRKISLRSSE